MQLASSWGALAAGMPELGVRHWRARRRLSLLPRFRRALQFRTSIRILIRIYAQRPYLDQKLLASSICMRARDTLADALWCIDDSARVHKLVCK